MSYKGRYVEILKDGRYNGVSYKKGEIWLIIDNSMIAPDIMMNNKKTTVQMFSSDPEARVLPEDYKPDQELKTILNKELQINLW